MTTKPNSKAKVRNKPSPVFDSKHPKVNDNKDHFPLGNMNQARNALARVNQYDTVPEWWNGNLQSLQNAVIKAVKKEYPSIEISEKAKQTKEQEKKASFTEVFKELMVLKTNYPSAYKAAVLNIKTKIASKTPYNGWNAQELNSLLKNLE